MLPADVAWSEGASPHAPIVPRLKDIGDDTFNEALWELKDRHLARFALYNVFSREEQEVELFNGRIDAAKARAFLERHEGESLSKPFALKELRALVARWSATSVSSAAAGP